MPSPAGHRREPRPLRGHGSRDGAPPDGAAVDERGFAFEEVGEAITALPAGQHFGKVTSRF